MNLLKIKKSPFVVRPVAFTLIEVIIGIAVLSVLLTAMTSLTITSLRANQANINQLTAYYLAQEGVEAFRNMRDSNWLQNQDYDGGASFWGATFDREGYYTVDYRPNWDSIAPSPWELHYYGNDANALDFALEKASLYKVNGASHFFYLHTIPTGATGMLSPYSRYLVVRPNAEGHEWFEVTAVVSWFDRNREQTLEVSTELSNWRQGPL